MFPEALLWVATPSAMFIDQAKIFAKAGEGGNGCSSFRREKYVPFGGPDGGDGGKGASIIVEASHHLTTLIDFRYRQHYTAKRGGHGEGNNRHGKNASDVIVRVPIGTIIRDIEEDVQLADLTEEGATAVVAHGGKGGRGNGKLATSTNQSPTRATPGTPGEARWLHLELKLLADIGLVGFPNAGKSSLIAALSAAKPKIADYPFTTLAPQLGMVSWGDEQHFVLADIPGIIKGAHAGKGLGIQFLRHIERTNFLLLLIDIGEFEPDDAVEMFNALRNELRFYAEGHFQLDRKPFAVVGTKLDLRGDDSRLNQLQSFCVNQRIPFFTVSSATMEGLTPLIQYVGTQLTTLREQCVTQS